MCDQIYIWHKVSDLYLININHRITVIVSVLLHVHKKKSLLSLREGDFLMCKYWLISIHQLLITTQYKYWWHDYLLKHKGRYDVISHLLLPQWNFSSQWIIIIIMRHTDISVKNVRSMELTILTMTMIKTILLIITIPNNNKKSFFCAQLALYCPFLKT